jgi:hypothetical protein
LSGLPATLAHGEGLRLPWLPVARATLLALSACWSLWLVYRQLAARVGVARRIFSLLAMTLAVAGVLAAWMPFIFR